MRLPRRRPTRGAHDPAALVAAAYQERLEALERLRAAHAQAQVALATAERERRSARAAIDRLETKARRALNEGDEEAARAAAAGCVPLDAVIAEGAERLRRLRDTERMLKDALVLVGQQIDTLRRRQAALAGSSGDAVVASVEADLAALAAAYRPVVDALTARDSDE